MAAAGGSGRHAHRPGHQANLKLAVMPAGPAPPAGCPWLLVARLPPLPPLPPPPEGAVVEPGWEPAAGLAMPPPPPVPVPPTRLGAMVAWMPSELLPWDCLLLPGPGRSSCRVKRG